MFQSARFNRSKTGVLLMQEDGIELFVDSGELYEQALVGNFGIIADYPASSAEEVKAELTVDIKAQRDSDLQNISYTFTDGRTVQVRPQDISNFQLAINRGIDQKWILSDNTVSLLTVTEMSEALSSGIEQGEVIWQACTAAIGAL